MSKEALPKQRMKEENFQKADNGFYCYYKFGFDQSEKDKYDRKTLELNQKIENLEISRQEKINQTLSIKNAADRTAATGKLNLQLTNLNVQFKKFKKQLEELTQVYRRNEKCLSNKAPGKGRTRGKNLLSDYDSERLRRFYEPFNEELFRYLNKRFDW